jgi:putative addiction module killer protein
MRRTEDFNGWLRKLRDLKARAIVVSRLDRLEDGNAGDSSSVGDRVSELRIHYGPGYRVYFTSRGGGIVILWGGTKATQARDIVHAKKLANNLQD